MNMFFGEISGGKRRHLWCFIKLYHISEEYNKCVNIINEGVCV
jgi:hypothetical protein